MMDVVIGIARHLLLCAVVLTCIQFLTSVASADPCTLYKPEDIQRARENATRYKWAQSIIDGWKSQTAYAMEQDREYFDQMIPELTNWTEFGQNCPACVNVKSSMGECGLYKWDVRYPDKLTCKYCGTVYPNEKYPETGSMTCPKMGQTFTYYETDEERAHPGEPPNQYAFKWVHWPIHSSWTGIIRSKKSHWAADQVYPLAKLYAVTGEVKYAERCSWILDRIARCYPNWLFFTYNGTYADCPPAEAAAEIGRNPRAGRFPKDVIIDPFNRHQKADYAELCVGFWGAGRFDSSGCDNYHLYWTVAYDLIRDARFEDGTPVLSPEMDQRIANDLLLAACIDMENWNEINNKCGPSRALSAACGILFQRPESARRALDGFSKLMEDCFHFDGFCRESPSYASMHLGLMTNIPEILRGYSDPPDYQPKEGERFDNLNPFEHVGRYRLALESMVRPLAPGNQYPNIGDTGYPMRLGAQWLETLTDRYSHDYAPLLEVAQGADLSIRGSEYALWYRDPAIDASREANLPLHTEWFPGWHVSVMRAGKPLGDTALYLNGYAYHGHRHHDTLGLIYHAFGREIASDRGYIWDDPRNAWTASTLSHNIVTVDGQSQVASGRPAAQLELFGAAPGIEITQARADGSYAQCDRYQRTTALVILPGEQTYAVDFFRANGGKLHQYGFQCNGAMVDLTAPAPEPVDDQIKWLSNLRACAPTQPFTATWANDDIRTDLTVLSSIDRLLVVDAPGWRSDRGSELNAPPIQQVFAERRAPEGAETLGSSFAAVIAPYRGDSPIISAALIAPEDGSDALAVEVKLAGRTDYIISNPDGAERQFGPVTLAGRFGFVSLAPDGALLQGYLLDGTELSCGGTALGIPVDRFEVPVEGVEGRTYHLGRPLPTDIMPTGAYVLAGDTGYEVETCTEDTITVRDYPAIECEQLTLLNSLWFEARP